MNIAKYRESRRHSITEGAWWSVQNGCGDNYLTAFFEFLGFKASIISFIVTFPVLFGSIIQTYILKKFFRSESKKFTILTLCVMQGMCWPALLLAGYLDNALIMVIVVMIIYNSVVAAQEPPWRAWMGSIVPRPIRGKYFGIRLSISGIVLLVSITLAGIVLDNFSSSGSYTGFVIIFCLALMGRMISLRYWNKMTEPKNNYKEKEEDISSFSQDQSVYLKFMVLYQFSVNIIVPLWAVYFLRDIKFSYLEYSYILVSGNFVGIASHYFWGRFIDKYRSELAAILGGWIMVFMPVLWYVLFYLSVEIQLIYSIVLFSIASFAAAGANLGLNNWILDIHDHKDVIPFSTRMVRYRGMAIFLGGIIGGGLTMLSVPAGNTVIPIGSSMHYAIFGSSIMRLISMVVITRSIKIFRKNSNENS
mgnify:CR=1 FL=1